MYYIERSCTEKKIDASDAVAESHPIAYFRECTAYVLLGEPGAGKTSLFKEEASNTDNSLYISARDFIDLNQKEWLGKTLFIDGLDEARAGENNTRTPLGAIRGKLQKLDCQCFRISCRDADWLGSPDAEDLKKISPDQAITILQLNPLSSNDIKQILGNDPRVADANDFMEKAEQFGLSGLLGNPQTLTMLIDAVKDEQKWPTSKQQVYELACKQLASEFNDDHAVTQITTNIQLIEAAGFLCAVQLIANLSGFTKGQASNGLVSLKDLAIPQGLPLHPALGTRLFIKTGNSGFSYVHRSVAEYLAAQFIAEKISQGLLANRVLALTTGFDGGIVAALRGLTAWLSVHSSPARERLIEIDPVGIVVYGDVSLFSKQDKAKLLRALVMDLKNTGITLRDWNTTAFAALTTHEMAYELGEIFNSLGRSDGEQFLLYCLLNGLSSSETLAEIKASLLAIIRDNSHGGALRSNALRAFIHQYPADLDSLLLLVDDIRQGKMDDTDTSLMDALLDKLFPSKITAASLLDYLPPPNINRVISYHYFWRTELPKRLTENDLAVILDQLFERGPDYLQRLPQEFIANTAGQLLINGLHIHGLNINAQRLYRWLSIGMDQYGFCKLTQEQSWEIATWLVDNPDRYLAVIGEGLQQITNFDNIIREIYKISARLRDATPPDTLAHWWLEQALSATHIELSRVCFEKAFNAASNTQNKSGLSLEFFHDWVADHPEYLETYNNLIYWIIPEWRLQQTNQTKAFNKQRDEEQKANLGYFHEHLTQMADGSAPAQLFNQLATAFSHLIQISGTSRENRLAAFLNSDDVLIAAAKSGLQKILQRTDLPTSKDIFMTAKGGEYHYIRLPFLVCMDTLYQENPNLTDTLSDDLLGTAVAFCLTKGAMDEAWFKALCQSKPVWVAHLYIDYITSLIAAKKSPIHELYSIANDQDFQNIVQLAVMPLLNTYPVRAYKDHVRNLYHLLSAAIAHIDKTELLALIEKKLACGRMDLAQRIYWLAAGLVIAPPAYEAKVKQTLLGKNQRINRLSDFLHPSFSSKSYGKYHFTASTKGLLIELFAPRCQPIWPRGGGFVTRDMEERDYVRFLLNSLADDPSEASAAILAYLQQQPNVSAWHPLIQNAQQTQQLSRREALFKHPNAEAVINTLDKKKPANVADLAALTVDCLEQLAKQLHGSNTDSYKHFWNVDGYNRPQMPRHEESCRDYLLEQLQLMLKKYDVLVSPEAHQAKDKRVDIEATFTPGGRTFRLPIEIKCDYNGKLWESIQEQLIPLYTIAPGTEGRGVYLVFWFNDKEKPPAKPEKGLLPPTSAEQLASMLKDSMTPQEQKLIDVVVLDVSKPV